MLVSLARSGGDRSVRADKEKERRPAACLDGAEGGCFLADEEMP
jgi:hypothetical protein